MILLRRIMRQPTNRRTKAAGGLRNGLPALQPASAETRGANLAFGRDLACTLHDDIDRHYIPMRRTDERGRLQLDAED